MLLAALTASPLSAAEEAAAPLGCVPHFAIDADMTPQALARAAHACVAVGVYDNAWALWMSFEAYAGFERARLTDPAELGAIADIYSWAFWEMPEGMTEAAVRFQGPGGVGFAAACAQIVAVGSPGYVAQVTGREGRRHAVSARFDAGAAWDDALRRVGCSDI